MPGQRDTPWVADRAIVFGLPLLVAWLAWRFELLNDATLLALAGPAASLAGFLACVAGLPVLPDGFLHESASAFAIMNLIAVLNLLPFRWRERRDTPLMSSDGRMIMDALIVKWALR